MKISHSWERFGQARWRWTPRFERLEPRLGRGFTVELFCFYWFVTGLLGCVHTLPPESADRKALDALESAWHAGLPDTGQCLDRVEVRRHGTRAAYVDECEGSHPELGRLAGVQTSAGCTTYALQGVMGRRVVVINVAPEYHSNMGLIQHEALHALRSCAFGDPDSAHADVRLWTAGGGAQSVQSRALGPN